MTNESTAAPPALTLSDVLRDAWVIAWRELLRFSRNKSRIVGALLFPLGMLALLSGAFGGGIPTPGDVSLSVFLLPGIAAMVVLFTGVTNGVSVIFDRELGFLKEILVAPVARSSIVLGKTLGGTLVAVAYGSLVLLAGAPFLMPRTIGTIGAVLAAIVVLVLLGMSMVGLGVAVAARVRSSEGFHAIINFLVLPMVFLSGALFPLEGTPTWLRTVVSLNPVSYGVDLLRLPLIGVTSFPLWLDLAVISGSTLALTLLGAVLFSRAP